MEVVANDGTMTNFSAFSTDVPTFSKKSILLDELWDVLNMADDGTDAFSMSLWFSEPSTSTQMLMTHYNGYNLYECKSF